MRRVYLVLAILPGWPSFASAQDPAAPFVARARAATEKYRDQKLAILDGYRRIGRDFPGMGEHWIRIGLLFDGKIDPERPEFLIYVPVSGKPELLGTAYALPLLPGESPPNFPAGKDAWHDHYRSVEDETALPHHHVSGTAGEEPRLAMLHAWIWAPNPGGMFAADNWAIPYLRLGIAARAGAPLSEALALSLLSGGEEYFSMSINAAALPDATQRSEIQAAFSATRSAVESRFQAGQVDGLGELWDQFRRSLDSFTSREAGAHLREILPKSNFE